MADPISEWVRDVLRWAKADALYIEAAAEEILRELRGGVTPSEPASPAPSLLRLIGRHLTRWA